MEGPRTGGDEMLQPLLEKQPTAQQDALLCSSSVCCKRSSPCQCELKNALHIQIVSGNSPPLSSVFSLCMGALLGFASWVCSRLHTRKEASFKPFYQRKELGMMCPLYLLENTEVQVLQPSGRRFL